MSEQPLDNKERNERIIELNRQGKGKHTIARELGLTEGIVGGVLKRARAKGELPVQTASSAPEATGEKSSPLPTPADTVSPSLPELAAQLHSSAAEIIPATADPLDALADQIKAEHGGVVTAVRTSLDHARRAGELLVQAKPLCGHGNWLKWLKSEVGISQATAWAYMQVAQQWDKLSVADNLRSALRLLDESKEPAAVEGPAEAEPAAEPRPEQEPIGSDGIDAKIAKSLGWSLETYRQVREIVAAAETEPEKYRDIQEEMDATGDVGAAWQKLKRRKEGEQPRAARKQRAETPHVEAPEVEPEEASTPAENPRQGDLPFAESVAPPTPTPYPEAPSAPATPPPSAGLGDRLAAWRASAAKVEQLLTRGDPTATLDSALDLMAAIQDAHDGLSDLHEEVFAGAFGVPINEGEGAGEKRE